MVSTESNVKIMNEENDSIPLTTEKVTNELFEDIINKGTIIMRDLQGEQQYQLADNIQKLLSVAQCFRQSFLDSTETIQQMKGEVEKATGRIAQAMKISQADQDTIKNLRLEVEKSWKLADAAQTREQQAQEDLYTIRNKLEKLQKDTEKHVDRGDEGLDELGGTSMMKHKEGLLRERDRLQAEVDELLKRLNLQRIYTEELEKKREESKNQVKDLVKQLDEHTNEQFKEKRLLESTQNDLKEITTERDTMLEELSHFKNLASQNHRTITSLNNRIATQKANSEKLIASTRAAEANYAKIKQDLIDLVQTKEKMTHELNVKLNLLKLRDDENNKYRLENMSLIKQKEGIMKKMVHVLQQNSEREQEIIKLKKLVVTFEKERETNKKVMDQTKKENEGLIRKLELTRKDLIRTNKTIFDLKEQILLHEQIQKNLENDIKTHVTAEIKLKTSLSKTEKERDRLIEETQILLDKLETANDEILHKQNYILEQKEKISEMQQKINQVQQLFETARTERNIYHRELQMCSEELSDLKERFKNSVREIEQLREELQTKSTELNHAKKLNDRMVKEKQSLQAEIQTMSINLRNVKNDLKDTKVQNGRLQKTILDDEDTINKLKKRIEATIQEKDIIGTQLIQRNDEISLLKEKMSIIQMALDRGESQYAKRLEDIRLLKIEIQNLQSQRDLLARSMENTADMRQEVLQLNRTLTQERVRSKALENEMLTPMNIHRWRKLYGEDPEKLDLIEKVHTLQKRILKQTAVAEDRETYIKESQKMYESLKEFVMKMPGDDTKNKLNSAQHELDTLKKKVKSLCAEIKINENELKAKDCIVERMKIELDSIKIEILDLKKANLFKKNYNC